MIRRFLRAAMPVLLVGASACNSDKLSIPSYNAPDVGGVAGDPTAIQLLATGMLAIERSLAVPTDDQFGRFGRESYDFFPTDSRNMSNFLIGTGCASCNDPLGPFNNKRLDPAGFASGLYLDRFRNMRNAVNFIKALGSSSLTAQQKDAGGGFARTLYGIDLLFIIESRDSLGSPVEITADANAQPPFVGRDSVYKRIFAELDSADAQLARGGTAFSFDLHGGFSKRGFGDVAGFRRFNRAMKARALVNYARIKRYHGTLGSGSVPASPVDLAASNAAYTQALAALGASFIGPIASVGDLALGPQHLYSTVAGDVGNGLSNAQNPNIIAHASLATAVGTPIPGSTPGVAGSPATALSQTGFVQTKAGGALDDRSTRKITTLPTPRSAPSSFGIPGYFRFQIYATPSDPVPVIRNEELVLMRAEANWFAGSKAAAIADLNTIRTVSGGLPAYTAVELNALSSDASFVDRLLYEATMSLILEGRRWVMYRGFNRLGALPRDDSRHFWARVMPIPKAECDARRGTPNEPPQCGQV